MSDVRRVPEKINKDLGSGGIEENIPITYSGMFCSIGLKSLFI